MLFINLWSLIDCQKYFKIFLFTILMLGSILFAELFLLCFINIHFYFMNIHWLLVMYDKVEYFSVFTFILNLFDNTFFWSLRMTVPTLYVYIILCDIQVITTLLLCKMQYCIQDYFCPFYFSPIYSCKQFRAPNPTPLPPF